MASNLLLPFEIITDILTRLPPKSLGRFKCVSKHFNSLINSPNFIKLHLSQTLISDNIYPNLLISKFSIFSSPITDPKNLNFNFTELNHPLKSLCRMPENPNFDQKFTPDILGSCNGMLCIALYDKSTIFLYNPSIQSYRLIPPFLPSNDTDPLVNASPGKSNVVIFGFGYDSLSDDYKILRIIERVTINLYGTQQYLNYSVYSMRDDKWKCLHDQTVFQIDYLHQNIMALLANEVLHFITVTPEYKVKVKCFDLRSERFSFLELPKFDDTGKKCLLVAELGGFLSVLVNYQSPEVGKGLVKADLWVLREYGNHESWSRLFTFDPSNIGDYTIIRPITFSKDKRWVLFNLDGSVFGWYNWSTDRFERVQIHGWLSSHLVDRTWTYVDSLVSLGKEEGKEKKESKLEEKPVPKKQTKRVDKDGFLSSGFKLRL